MAQPEPVDDRHNVTAVKKDPKTTVSDISNNLQRAGVKVSQSTVRRRLHEQKYRGYTRRIGDEPQKFWDKVLWTDFMDQSDGKAKVWRERVATTEFSCGASWTCLGFMGANSSFHIVAFHTDFLSSSLIRFIFTSSC